MKFWTFLSLILLFNICAVCFAGPNQYEHFPSERGGSYDKNRKYEQWKYEKEQFLEKTKNLVQKYSQMLKDPIKNKAALQQISDHIIALSKELSDQSLKNDLKSFRKKSNFAVLFLAFVNITYFYSGWHSEQTLMGPNMQVLPLFTGIFLFFRYALIENKKEDIKDQQEKIDFLIQEFQSKGLEVPQDIGLLEQWILDQSQKLYCQKPLLNQKE